MRFEVPQFIEIEDKIFGPFTWKQFVYLGGGIGLAVVLFFTTPFIITFIVGIPLAILSAALAFYPVNNRPFSVLLESMWNYYKGSRMYYWRRNHDVVYKGELREVDPNLANIPQRGDNGLNSVSNKLKLNVLTEGIPEPEE